MRLFGPAGIDSYVEDFLRSNSERFAGKTVVDVPAGSGRTSDLLRSLGAAVEAFDLFPECFNAEGLLCRKADLTGTIPVRGNHADFVISQEGIEHVPDHVNMFQEFNRILKKGGILFLTTPNYSNLRIKLGYMLSESEYAFKRMPPNELDSIWGREGEAADGNGKNIAVEGGVGAVYFGHVFPVGIQKLRFLAQLAGFRIRKVYHTKVNGSSLALMFLFYPFILVINWLAYRRALGKRRDIALEEKREVYGEILKYSIDPRILVDGYLFVEFVKESDLPEVFSRLRTRAG
jgi:SAM-dependent methyltransferase